MMQGQNQYQDARVGMQAPTVEREKSIIELSVACEEGTQHLLSRIETLFGALQGKGEEAAKPCGIPAGPIGFYLQSSLNNVQNAHKIFSLIEQKLFNR